MKKAIQQHLQAWLEEQDSRFYGGVYVMDDTQLQTKNPNIIGICFEESCSDKDEWDWGFMEELKEKIVDMDYDWEWYNPIELHIYPLHH